MLGENVAQSMLIELSKGKLNISTALLGASHFQHTKWHKQIESLTKISHQLTNHFEVQNVIYAHTMHEQHGSNYTMKLRNPIVI